MYSMNCRVRYSELNHKTHTLDPYGIINYFQDCSTFQSESLNLGFKTLQEHKRAWILNSWQLHILSDIRLGDNITVSTWAHDFKGFFGHRNFLIKDDSNKDLAVANSIWIFMDTETGRPSRIPKDNIGYKIHEAYPMEYLDRKILLPKNPKDYSPFPVVSSNIDSYKHVNNAQYVKMAQEFLPDDFKVNQMRVEYSKQARLGDTILPQVFIDGDLCIVNLANLKEEPYAIIEFKGIYK